jgi:hypothetical protein
LKILQVWVVTHNFYRWDDLSEKLENRNRRVTVFYRDYNFEDALEHATPDLILSRGICKTRDEKSVGIYYSAREAVRKAGKKIPVFPDVFPRLWLWIYRIFFKKTK